MSRGAVVLLGAVLVVTFLAGPVAAHEVQSGLPVETQLLYDEWRDEFYYYDGYDLADLYIREAYNMTSGESGVVFRWTLYGGFGPAETSENLHVDIGVTAGGEERTFRLSTPDDETWSGDLDVVAKNVTQIEDPLYPAGVTTTLQAFATYDQLGVGPGANVSGFRMVSLADDDPRDVAPGGIYVPNSMGMVETPPNNGQAGEALYLRSERLVDELELSGPTEYVDVDAEFDGWNATLKLTNPFESQGQHVVVRPARSPNWTVDAATKSPPVIDGGETASVQLTVEPSPSASKPLPVHVISDIGGHETVYIGTSDGTLELASDAESATVEPPEPAPASTPGFEIYAVLGAVGAALWIARRP